MTVGVTQAWRHRGPGGGLRVDRATHRRRSPPTRRRPVSPRSSSCRPDGVALGKLAQTLAYGAQTLLVRGDFDDCLRLVEEASIRLGVYLLNSINPFRLEGQKTIVLEMLQQLGWEPPDWIVPPGGQSRKHGRVRKGAPRGARVGTDLQGSAPRGGAGGRSGAVRAELRGRIRALGTR